MDVSKMRKSLTEQIQKNIMPISTHLLPLRKSLPQAIEDRALKQQPNQLERKELDISMAHQNILANSHLDHRSNIRIITCLKVSQHLWSQYIKSNRNGQTSSEYLLKFKKIDIKLNQEIDKLVINGSNQQVKNTRDLLKPVIDHLQKRSRKFLQHQSEFKVISRKIEQIQQDQEDQQEQIKKQMVDLVQKFKQYAVNIQDDLVNDEKVIDDIGKIQDKQIDSLQSKTEAMKEIIAEQRIGFFQLMVMGVVAILLWLFGMIVIIIV